MDSKRRDDIMDGWDSCLLFILVVAVMVLAIVCEMIPGLDGKFWFYVSFMLVIVVGAAGLGRVLKFFGWLK